MTERFVMSDQCGERSSVVETLRPEAAFELLAHETRFAILEALNEAEEPLSFTELRTAVGVADPGGFNYHLGKLVGSFVTHVDDGYEIADPGRQAIGTVLSGMYTTRLDAPPVRIPDACLHCDGTMETRFQKKTVRMVCLECQSNFNPLAIPPSVLDGWDHERAPEIIDRWVNYIRQTAELGFCYVCAGRLRRTVTPLEDGGPPLVAHLDLEATVRIECDRCRVNWLEFPAASVLAKTPVIAFHDDHGIDVRTTPFWELEWLRTGISTVVDEEPLRVEIPVALPDETLVVTVDETLEVVHTRRE